MRRGGGFRGQGGGSHEHVACIRVEVASPQRLVSTPVALTPHPLILHQEGRGRKGRKGREGSEGRGRWL